jgi:hypothetical protein
MPLSVDLLKRIRAKPVAVWTARDFADLGTRSAVDTALHRMSDAGQIKRIGHGLYYLPRLNSLTGQPDPPDHMAVIAAIARRDGLVTLVDGMTSANNLGFTNAVPAGVTVLTNGRSKSISLGNLKINFRQVAPSRLVWASRPAAHLVQALIWLRDADQASVRRRTKAILDDLKHGPAIRADLKAGLGQLPAWLLPAIKEALGAV